MDTRQRLLLAVVVLGSGFATTEVAAEHALHGKNRPIQGGVDPAAVAAARQALDTALLNYPGARFRSVRFVRTGMADGPQDTTGFCGEVNAQNRAGGFTGWSRFFLAAKPLMDAVPQQLFVVGVKGPLDNYQPGVTDQLVETLCGPKAANVTDQDYSTSLTFSSGR